MKSIPCDDSVFGSGSIRVDGRKLHPMLLLQAKTPAESRYAWDYMRVVRSIPAKTAFRRMDPGLCALGTN
jgi:branched-chain amino acid transport system substrate-binding protein